MALGTVILVPGWLGSVLGDEGLPPFTDVVWLNPLRILTGAFTRLRLAVPGEPDPPPPGPPLSGGYPLPLYYSLLTRYLEGRGWRVVSPYADWRLPVTTDAAILASVITSEAQANPVHLVCHSRGGLVARKAIQLLQQSGNIGMVRRVIFMGTPHTGSLVAVSALCGWSYLQARLYSLSSYLPPTLGDHLGVTDINRVMRSWPSLYELLPAPSAPWLPASVRASLYLPATYADSPLSPVASYITAAAAHWSAMPPFPLGPTWLFAVGRGVWTPNSIPDVSQIATPHTFDGDYTGDGTVPYASAAISPFPVISTPCQHDLLPADGRLYPVLHDALLNGLQEDVRIEGRTLTL